MSCVEDTGRKVTQPAGKLPRRRFSEEPGIAVELVKAALETGAPSDGSAGNNGPAAGQPGPSVAAGISPQQQQRQEEAEALVLELVSDDRLLERVCEEGPLRCELLSLLWNHAVLAMHSGRAVEAALPFFTASLPLLGGGSAEHGGSPQAAEAGSSQQAAPSADACRRAQALCCMGGGQYERWVAM